MRKCLSMMTAILMSCQLAVINTYAMTGGMPMYLKSEVTSAFGKFIDEYGILLNGVWGFFMASSILVFIIHFIKLGRYSGIPFVRAKIMNDLLITGICTAVLGSFGFVFALIRAFVLQ